LIAKHARLWSVLVLIALPILVNAPLLTNAVKGDFALLYGGFATRVEHGALPGYPLIDPTIGFGNQTIGHRVAAEIAHGRMPWWNPYEGAGFPMGESIGNAAFFPFTLLLGLPRGQALDVTALEIAAGLGTMLVIRRLGLGWLPAVVGGALFELNAAFCWIAGDIANTAPFLPWLIYGIERVRAAAVAERPLAWGWVAGALALSLYAGFPESAYLNGLLALGWAVVRFAQLPLDQRGLFARGLFAGGAVGMLLATPILLAFYDDLRISFAGAHLSGAFAQAVLPRGAEPMLLLPYVWGPIFVYAPVYDVWSNVGGFIGTAPAVLALAALFGRRERAIRWLLAGWTIVGICASFGMPLLHAAFVHVPLVSLTAFYRYLPQSWGFSLALLCAFALAEALVLERAALAKRYALALALVLAALGAVLYHNRALVAQMRPAAGEWLFGSLEFALAVLLALAVAAQLANARARAGLLIGALLVEAVAYFGLPMLSYPRGGTLDLAAIGFLQRNLGFQRFYTLGPIQPNYGSLYGIASINHIDLPVPNAWLDFIHTRLDPFADPINFTGSAPPPGPGVPSRAAALRAHVGGFEAAGVKYVVAPAGENPFIRGYETVVGKGAGTPTNVTRGVSVVATVGGKGIPDVPLRSVGVLQGNYGNSADGTLRVQVCNARRQCATGSRSLRESADNAYFNVPLAQPLRLGARPVTIAFSSSSDKPEALWAYPAAPGASDTLAVGGKPVPNAALRIRLVYATNEVLPRRVYEDGVMTIYELAHPRPYAEAPGCTLEIRSHTALEANCRARSELRRLELLAPGWSARVNGTATEVAPFDRTFQRVALPAGRSTIVFSFSPPGIAYGYAAFLAGALALAGLALDALRRARTRTRPRVRSVEARVG
jgi:hypothetical protein